MGWRFRKSLNLGGGFKLNLGKKSAGISFGRKGARISVNSSGRRTVTLGIPGTGLYWQKSSSSRRRSKSRNSGCVSFFALLLVLGLIASIISFVIHHWILILCIAIVAVSGLVLILRLRRTKIDVECPGCETKFQRTLKSIQSKPDILCPSCNALIHINLVDASAQIEQEPLQREKEEYNEKTATNQYFTMLGKIEEYRASHQYKKVLDLSLQSVDLLPGFVSETVKEFGMWDIPSVPCIMYACKYLSAIPDTFRLRDMREKVNQIDELSHWVGEIDTAVSTCGIAEKVYSLLTDQPGFHQNKLGRALSEDGRLIANILHYAEQLEIVRREREGKTYRLYLVN